MKKWYLILILLLLAIASVVWVFNNLQPEEELDRLNQVVFKMVDKHNLISTHADLQKKLIYIEVSSESNVSKIEKDIKRNLEKNNLQYSLDIQVKDLTPE